VSRAHQPNIDLSLAQNAPINDVQPFPCRLGASHSHFISPTSLLQTSSTLALSQCCYVVTREEYCSRYCKVALLKLKARLLILLQSCPFKAQSNAAYVIAKLLF
jgi:hypothetical protein